MSHSIDLNTCDREPIHIPGSIQAHGCILVCSSNGARVLRSSDNAADMLGLPGDPRGKPLGDLIDRRLVHDLLNALAKAPEPRRPALLQAIELPGGTFDISIHSHAGDVIIEFEPATAPGGEGPLEIARTLITRSQLLTDRDAIASRVPRFLQALLGYDRVMLYEFAADGSGKVIGEAKRSHLESFLGQHFPASDIPRQARELYMKNTIRIVADANGPTSRVVPQLDESGAALDLSFAHLRSVSPIHLEYLRNMGVGASMSISIIVGGALWGLIACHHYEPKRMQMAERVAAELYGDFLSLHLTALHHRARADATLRARGVLDRLISEMSFHEDVDAFLRANLQQLSSLMACDGIGLWRDGIWTSLGAVPPQSRIPQLARLASEMDTSAVFATHAIAERLPDAKEYSSEAAGVLAIPLSVLPGDYLFFFRKAKLQTLDWAGDPNKTYTVGPLGDRLTPRKSFAVWKEIVEGQSEPWLEEDRHISEALLFGLREIIMRQSEILAAERKKAEVRQRVLNDELNHRVKNILALIKSLVNQPTETGESLESFISGLRGRILALSHAHDQIVRSDGGGGLRQLLEAELSPYNASQIEFEGVAIGLDARSYSVMALVLHELATNAAKYGALSNSTGRLIVTCKLQSDGSCTIHWLESGGPPVKAPTRRGFGSVLLHRSVPFDLQGTSEIDYHPHGVEARFMIPARFIMDRIPRTTPKTNNQAPGKSTVNFAMTSVLLVEDQLVIALDAEDMLRDIGVSELTTVATAQDALRAIARATPNMAVLDVNLGTGNSIVIADELAQRGVPFVFATGYGDSIMIPDKLSHIPVVRKPYTTEALKAALERASNRPS